MPGAVAGDGKRQTKQPRLAVDDLGLGPALGALRVDAHHYVVVAGHHRLGTQVDGEDLGQHGEAFDHPGLAVGVVVRAVPRSMLRIPRQAPPRSRFAWRLARRP
jgi:hypothetical protein